MKILFLLLSILLFIIWLFFLIRLFLLSKQYKFAMQGLLKQYVYKKILSEVSSPVLVWLNITLLFWFVTCITVCMYLWKTDYSFFIAIFPIFWFFLFSRFIVWDRQDIKNRYKKNDFPEEGKV